MRFLRFYMAFSFRLCSLLPKISIGVCDKSGQIIKIWLGSKKKAAIYGIAAFPQNESFKLGALACSLRPKCENKGRKLVPNYFFLSILKYTFFSGSWFFFAKVRARYWLRRSFRVGVYVSFLRGIKKALFFVSYSSVVV